MARRGALADAAAEVLGEWPSDPSVIVVLDEDGSGTSANGFGNIAACTQVHTSSEFFAIAGNYSYEVLRDKGQPSYRVLFKDFKSVEAIDDLTVKFTFNPDGALRELAGTGALFANMDLLFGPAAASWKIVLVEGYQPFLLAILPPGAFVGLALLIALKNKLDELAARAAREPAGISA